MKIPLIRKFHVLSVTASVCWLFEVLGLVVGGEALELKLVQQSHYC